MSDAERICGYCHTATHDKCRPVIRWFDKEWFCNCKCQLEKENSNG